MEILLDNEVINVNIIRKHNKNIYFRINDNLELSVTVPFLMREKEVVKLIEQNKQPLLKMYLKAKDRANKDTSFRLLGNVYTIVNDPTLKSVSIEDEFIFTPSDKALNLFLKKETIKVFNERIDVWKNHLDFVPQFQLKIRKMKTRWGVCNKTKRIVTLNSELIKRDISIIDYVVIHELCHFKYPNHQREFWNLVSEYCPTYKIIRKRLKES